MRAVIELGWDNTLMTRPISGAELEALVELLGGCVQVHRPNYNEPFVLNTEKKTNLSIRVYPDLDPDLPPLDLKVATEVVRRAARGKTKEATG